MSRPFGYCHTEVTKRRIGNAHRGMKRSLLTKSRISRAAKNRLPISEETRAKLSQKKMGNTTMVGKHLTEKTKEKLRQVLTGRFVSEETKRKHREYWADEDWANRQRKLQFEGMQLKPNKPETALLELLNEYYPSEWEYVGDGKIVIERLTPDFINTNGQKLIIEMFGDYWHGKGQKPNSISSEKRIQKYAKYGYRTLIIWETDITRNKDKVKTDIDNFLAKEVCHE